jgi:hypothetical protein
VLKCVGYYGNKYYVKGDNFNLVNDITVMYKELCKSRSLCEDMKERVQAERASEKKSHYNEKGQTKGAFETPPLSQPLMLHHLNIA